MGIPLILPNIDIFTSGESSLFGYDSSNYCLIVHSLIEVNNLTAQSIDRLHLSSSPISPIQQLILNPDETMLALISDKTAYHVYLPQSNNSPSKGFYKIKSISFFYIFLVLDSRLCPLNVIRPLVLDGTQLNNFLIDFLWLSPLDFGIIYSIPSSSECHLYNVGPSESDGSLSS